METDLGIQTTEGPKQDKPKIPTPKLIIIKLAKVKEKILKAARKKTKNHWQKNHYKANSRFLCRKFAGHMAVAWYIQNPEKEKMQSRTFHPAGLSFRIREIKDFSDRQ